MNLYLQNISSMKVQQDHPKSPYYIYINGEYSGSIRGSEHSDVVMKLLQRVYEKGVADGKELRSAELRRLL